MANMRRVSDTVYIGQKKSTPYEVEELLRRHPRLFDVLCLPGVEKGCAVAFVTCQKGTSLIDQRSFTQNHAKALLPAVMIELSAISMDVAGRPARKYFANALKHSLLIARCATTKCCRTNEEFNRKVASLLQDIIGVERISFDAPLMESGLNSLLMPPFLEVCPLPCSLFMQYSPDPERVSACFRASRDNVE